MNSKKEQNKHTPQPNTAKPETVIPKATRENTINGRDHLNRRREKQLTKLNIPFRIEILSELEKGGNSLIFTKDVCKNPTVNFALSSRGRAAGFPADSRTLASPSTATTVLLDGTRGIASGIR